MSLYIWKRCRSRTHGLHLAMIILYTVSPLLYRLASSAYYNLSLLSSDFYGLLFGMVRITFSARNLIVFLRIVPLRMRPWIIHLNLILKLLHSIIGHSGYTLSLSRSSFAVLSLTSGHLRVGLLCVGLYPYTLTLHCHLLAEEQGFLDPKAPDYVNQKRGGPALPDDERIVQGV